MTTTIALKVSYGQLAVFSSALSQPFNDWTDQHVSQGFAWRPDSVSFRTMADGRHLIQVSIIEHADNVSPDTVRAIEVPFKVPADGAIEVGGIAETSSLLLKAGIYLLRCEFLQPVGSDKGRMRLIFASKDIPRFAVVRADDELSIKGELLTTAHPALG